MARHSVGLLLVLTLLVPMAANAQVDSLLVMPTRSHAGGRISTTFEIPRARYRMATDLDGGRAEERLAEEFGWVASQLKPARSYQTGLSTHLTLQQTLNGVPVWNRRVTISLDHTGSVSMVVNGFDPGVSASDLNTTPLIAAAEAREIAERTAGPASSLAPELVVLPGSRPRLAWRTVVWPVAQMAEREVLVDAHDGAVLLDVDRTARRRAATFLPNNSPSQTTAPPNSAEARVDGVGFIFDPDPLATSGSDYLPPYVDANDADSPALTAELKTVTLRDITLGTDGLYRLEGPALRIVGENSGGVTVYDPPAEVAPNFEYTRSQSGFEAVNVYYHIDANQRYVQSLGFSDLQSQSPLRVNPAGSNADDSGWLASQRFLFFGTGGVDDGEDAAVILHEYAHALLEAGAPGIRSSLEGQAYHEGWADYWAMSYQRSLIDAGLVLRSDWEEVFRWDSGIGTVWPGRRLDFSGTYPQDTCSDNGSASGCSVHNDGRLWGTVMMNVYTDLGREITDRLNLLSHRYLAPGMTFRDGAEAVIQADVDHYNGDHVELLVAHFTGFGLVDPASFGPILTHTPLVSQEPVDGTRNVSLVVRALASTISSVSLHYQIENGPVTEVVLSRASGDTYSGELPLPGRAATVSYFLRAVDSENRDSVLPDGAPGTVFSFEIGTDTQAPSVAHTPVGATPLSVWPPTVLAVVNDDLGVSSVRVGYDVTVPGQPALSGSFPLQAEGDRFTGEFDLAVGQVAIGARVSYTIEAIDVAAVANVARVGPFEFQVSGVGVLRSFDSDASGSPVLTSGQFTAGLPASGTNIAHSGESVWGTNPSGPYAPVAGVSSLALPELNLQGAETPKLEFWHWYDIEHDGRAEPGTTGGEVLWDGGNVKVSLDQGASWSILNPQGGYTGRIVGGPDNPMAGQLAFGGFSYGWRREVMELPAEPSLMIRFDFGADATNSESSVAFGGWLLDDIQVTTSVAPGPQFPFLAVQIEPTGFFPAAVPLPTFSVQALDDTGISDSWIDYTFEGRSGTQSGTARLTQSPISLVRYQGQILTGLLPAPGDQIAWRIRLRDVDGNVTTVPGSAAEPFKRDIRLSSARSVIESASASGTWTRDGSSWEGVGSGMGALILAPISVPANTSGSRLVFVQSHGFSPASGGQVEISSDDGGTWQLGIPSPEYRGTVDAAGAFVGQASADTRVLDLTPWAGEVVRVRFVSVGRLDTENFWRLSTLTVQHETAQDAFELPESVVLHANFPDPFSASTNISYSLPEPTSVTLVLYDLLGRRVSIIDSGSREAGNHVVLLQADGLAGGSYILRLEAGGTTVSEMVVVAR